MASFVTTASSKFYGISIVNSVYAFSMIIGNKMKLTQPNFNFISSYAELYQFTIKLIGFVKY